MTCIEMGNCFGSFNNVDNVKSSYVHRTMSTSQNSISVDRNAPIPPGVTRFPSQSSHPLPTPDSATGMHKNESETISMAERQILSSPELKSFLHSELKKATEDFHPDNLLGEGGFGLVYKGWLDEKNLKASSPGAGIPVAVKKLKPQGLQGHKEWLCEVEYLGRLHHPNLVKLLGFCLEGENRLLVYEYMPQGSLENHLFRRSEAPLSWETRVKIAIGAARGLCFLHDSESQIIYRDFKASNILLDSEFNAKLSDFGLAKKGPSGDDTHVTTAVMGTEGYAAPEYITTGKLSTKCDVYSFGVVLFEMLTGRRAVDYTMGKAEHHLLHWVKPHLRDKRSFVRIMDSRLEGQYPRKAAFIAATLALHCVNHERKFRPTMSEVLGYLEFLESPKFMSLPPPPPLQKEHIDHQTNSPPESPETLGSSAASSPDCPATSSNHRATPRLSSPPKPHRPNHRCSPAGPRQPQHRSRFSGSFVPSG